MHTVISTVNSARRYALDGNEKVALQILTSHTGSSPVIDSLLDDLSYDLKNDRVFELISNNRSEILFGNFSCSYHPYLGLECSSIVDIRPSILLEDEFEHIRCVRQGDCTEGIKNSQVVAIFPENFKGHSVRENDPVYYFVNKFAERHIKFTRPYLATSRMNDFLNDVLCTDTHKIYELVANWVHVHEMSHRKGPMPLPRYLKEKSGRYSAALEELRADLGVIQYCLRLGSDEAVLTAKYVLAERLIAYPLFRERKNFDAISSVWFWKVLLESEFFISPSLEALALGINIHLRKIQIIEEMALSYQTNSERRNFMNRAVEDSIGGLHEQFEKYHDFWERV